jgi:hypothetical protein
MAKKTNKAKYFMVRSYAAGVFMGQIVSRKSEANGVNVVLKDARRIWYWAGAASLSQLATDGTSDPKSCKFPCAVERVELMNVIEIIPVTAKAKFSIDAVEIWKK